MSSNSEKDDEIQKSYTFKICGIDKEISLKLSGETSISTILEQLSSFCSIKSTSLQIRNGNENLNDINKKLNDYIIEDPTNFLVLRDDILEQNGISKKRRNHDGDSKVSDDDEEDDEEEEDEEEDDDDDDDEDEDESDDKQKQAMHLQNDGSVDFIHSEIYNIKSPQLPAVPHNSCATDLGSVKKQSQGLYSALEALSASNNAKKLNSLSTKKN